MMTDGESMKLQLVNGAWINERHVIVYYISEDSKTIGCLSLGDQCYTVLKPENELVTQELLDDTMRVITSMALNNQLLSQYDLWKALNRIK
jgi:hypothetical protein